jgi:hypothetical protein
MDMEILIIGVASAFNFLIVKWKLEHERYADVAYDVIVLLSLGYLFGGTLGGMTIAMVASTLVSLHLMRYPPKKPMWDRNLRKIVWVE